MAWFHTIVVNITIGLVAAAVAADFLHLLTGRKRLKRSAGTLLLSGSLAAVAAVISGWQTAETVRISAEAASLVEAHRLSGLLTLISLAALGIFRLIFGRLNRLSGSRGRIYYALAIIALLFVFRTGLLGSELSYLRSGGGESKSPPLEKPSFQE